MSNWLQGTMYTIGILWAGGMFILLLNAVISEGVRFLFNKLSILLDGHTAKDSSRNLPKLGKKNAGDDDL